MKNPVYLYAWISVDTDRIPPTLGGGGGAWREIERPTTAAANLACDAAQALLAGVTPPQRDCAGLFIGNTIGSLRDDVAFDLSRVADGGKYPNPNVFRRTLPSSIATEMTIDLGLHGPVVVYAAGAASAAVACVRGTDYVRRGWAEMAIVGGIEIWTTGTPDSVAKSGVPIDAAACSQPRDAGERCQIVLALVAAADFVAGRRPMGEFTQGRLDGSKLYSPGQMDCSLGSLVDLLATGQGRMVVDGGMGIQALLELKRR